jgi:TetR/AcrR family transcriptional regulator, transcriptional repressor for nem operon
LPVGNWGLFILDHLVYYRFMRPKTFDTDEALLAALSVFWERGFESTNMPELLEQMNVGRASFYNAFDSKRDVFLKSLDLYFANVDAHLTALVANTETSERAVAALVDGILEVAKNARTGSSGWRGCFLGNTALELGANDREIADRLRVGIEVLKAQFKRALALPSAAGAKRRDSEIDALALHLVANIQGLLVLAKSGLAEADVKIARTTLLATLI